MRTVAEALCEAAERLSATSDTARLDAEILMAHALGMSRSDMLLKHMRDPMPEGFAALVDRRALHEPVAHIVGRQEFYGLDFAVTPDTLIPRGDSETIVEAALDMAGDTGRVLDLGTGSGALLLAFLANRPGWTGVGTDRSPAALAVAHGNADALGIEGRARFFLLDWLQDGWSEDLGRFDLVLCNPPYVEADAALDPDVRLFEPAGALFAGPEGLDDYLHLVPQVSGLLAPGGTAIFEIGHQQAAAIAQIARFGGLECAVRQDLAGRDRAAILTRGVGKGGPNV